MLAFFLCTLTECNFSRLKCQLCLTCLVTQVLCKMFTHMCTHTHLHCTDIRITVFHKQRVFVSSRKQTTCIYTHLNVDCPLLTHLPAMQVITYYIQKLKQCH